jgi:hypothetical protein
MKNGAPNRLLGSGTTGCAVKCETCTTKGRPFSSGSFGVITRSSPSGATFARRPLTVTLPTESPSKSRLNRDSDCVARASRVTVPSIPCDGADVA